MDAQKSYYHQRIRQERKEQGKCQRCGHPISNGQVKCDSCRQRHRQEQRRFQARKAHGTCVSCKNPTAPGRTRCKPCAEKGKACCRRRRLQVADMVFAAYGGAQCRCCGEPERLFLSIDHINGGGARQRRELGPGELYRWLLRNNFPPGYQVLCHNCNFGKHWNNGICPHKKAS